MAKAYFLQNLRKSPTNLSQKLYNLYVSETPKPLTIPIVMIQIKSLNKKKIGPSIQLSKGQWYRKRNAILGTTTKRVYRNRSLAAIAILKNIVLITQIVVLQFYLQRLTIKLLYLNRQNRQSISIQVQKMFQLLNLLRTRLTNIRIVILFRT